MTSRIEKLQAMAADTSSPHEAKIARAKLNEMQGKASEALKRFAEDGRNRYANIDIKNMFYLRDSLNGTINIKMSSGSGGVGGFGGSYTAGKVMTC